MRRFWRRLGATVLLLVLAAAALTAWGVYEFTSPGPLRTTRAVVVPRGAGVDSIANQLADAGVIAQPQLFQLAATLISQAGRLKPGEYAFAAFISPREIIDEMSMGHTVKRHVTIPEGWSNADILALLRADDALDGPVAGEPPRGAYPRLDGREGGRARRRAGTHRRRLPQSSEVRHAAAIGSH